MGKCIINVEVVGGHHNGHKSDIDQLAHGLVADLRTFGHSIISATLVEDGKTENLLDSASRIALKHG